MCGPTHARPNEPAAMSESTSGTEPSPSPEESSPAVPDHEQGGGPPPQTLAPPAKAPMPSVVSLAPVSGPPPTSTWLRGFILGLLCLGILAGGGFAFTLLWKLRKPPQKRTRRDRTQRVTVRIVNPTKLCLPVRAFGSVRPSRRLVLVPEVQGLALEVSPRLRAGGILAKGELMVRLDDSRYLLRLRRAKAVLAGLSVATRRLIIEKANLIALKEHTGRLVKVAQDEVHRLETLAKSKLSSASATDAARRAALQLETSLVQTAGQLALLPSRAEELAARRAEAQTAVEEAKLDLGKTRLVAPFRAKVERSTIERGAFIAAGREAAVLVDQSRLEVLVSLSPEETRWLDPRAQAATIGGPGGAAPSVQLSWRRAGRLGAAPSGPAGSRDDDAAARDPHHWSGRVARLERVDPRTRTVDLVIEVEDPWSSYRPDQGGLPLTVGMFCELSLPGREVTEAVLLPRELIGSSGQVMVVAKGKLALQKVQILRSLPAGVLVHGLAKGTPVVTSRLAFAVQGAPVVIEKREGSGR